MFRIPNGWCPPLNHDDFKECNWWFMAPVRGESPFTFHALGTGLYWARYSSGSPRRPRENPRGQVGGGAGSARSAHERTLGSFFLCFSVLLFVQFFFNSVLFSSFFGFWDVLLAPKQVDERKRSASQAVGRLRIEAPPTSQRTESSNE